MTFSETLGTDLPVTDLSLDNRSPADPAPSGWSKDASGNLYRDRSQGSGSASERPGTSQEASGDQTARVEGTGADASANDPTRVALEAAQAEARAARETAQKIEQAYQADQARREETAWRDYYNRLPNADAKRLALRERQVEVAARQVQAAHTAIQQQQVRNEPFYRNVAIDLLQKEYGERTGLDAETFRGILSKQQSPHAMEAIAQTLTTLSRDAKLQQRAAQGTDAAATAGSGTSRPANGQSWKQMSKTEQLTAAFDALG